MRQKSVTPSSPSERLVKNIRRATRSNALTRQTDSMAGLHFAQGQVFDRLRDEHGFTGGYTIVRYCVREQQRRGRAEGPLLCPGPAAQRCDLYPSLPGSGSRGLDGRLCARLCILRQGAAVDALRKRPMRGGAHPAPRDAPTRASFQRVSRIT